MSAQEPEHVAVGLADARGALERRRSAPPAVTEAEAETARHDMLIERARMRWDAFCPGRFLDATVDDFGGEEVQSDLEAWAVNPAGRNLVLFGPVGAGKSHAACAAARPLVERGVDARFLPADELLDRVWSRTEQAALDELARIRLLVIDDLGSEPLSEWDMSRIYAVTNRRWLEERITIVTTNADPTKQEGGLETVVGPRTFSRLVGGAVVLRISGQDRRRKRART